MLKGVVSNMHLLAKFSREAGFLPYIGHAHYTYECYLKSQINSSRPPSGCDLSTVWSLQTDLDKDMPKVCSLAMKPSLWPQDPSGITFHATRAPCQDVGKVRKHYCGCDIQLQSVITVSEEGDIPEEPDRPCPCMGSTLCSFYTWWGRPKSSTYRNCTIYPWWRTRGDTFSPWNSALWSRQRRRFSRRNKSEETRQEGTPKKNKEGTNKNKTTRKKTRKKKARERERERDI